MFWLFLLTFLAVYTSETLDTIWTVVCGTDTDFTSAATCINSDSSYTLPYEHVYL